MKELLLDVDGVVIRPRNKYFSEKFSEDYRIPLDQILPFFKGEYKKAAIGEVNIKDILPDYLQKWGWKGTVDDFLKYWYESEKDVDQGVLKIVRELRKNGVRVHLVSDNEAGRAKYLMEVVGLGKEFDSGFFSSELGVTKSDPQFFQKVAEQLQTEAGNIIYFDDDQKNVDAAKGVGIDAHLFENIEDLKETVNQK